MSNNNNATSNLDKTPPNNELGRIGSSTDLTNKNSLSNSASMINNSSWANTVSQYLLQRHKQTQLAYQSQLPMTDTDDQTDINDGVFESLFERLIQRLEEGHTVVTLSDIDQADELWQRQLIQPLFQPLLDYVASTLARSVDIESLMINDHALWKTSMLQSSLSQFEQQHLQQRYRMVIELYNYLQRLNDVSVKNSLSKFVEDLNQHTLVTNKADREGSSPIIFKVISNTSNIDKEQDKLILTLWLHRTWKAEYDLADHITRIKAQSIAELPITKSSQLNDEQQDAIYMSNRSAFSIITGGPGTGKTFTIAQLVIALHQVKSQTTDITGDVSTSINLALAAPTGKAAQRMQESLQDAIAHAGVTMQLPEAKTIHRLLGIGQGGQPRYHVDHTLSEDIIIVDEASMLGVELANYLVSAIKPNARLILLGDANQLAAVDAGAVLADLCRIPKLQDVHRRLESSRRFTEDSGIGKLATLINQESSHGEYDAKSSMANVWELIGEDETLNFYRLTPVSMTQSNNETANEEVRIINSLSSYKFYSRLLSNYKLYIARTNTFSAKHKGAKSIPVTSTVDNFNTLMSLLNQFRILTAGHHGRCGDIAINQYLSEQHRRQLKLPLSQSSWYHGRPIMVLQNNYELGLFNGDIGICLQTENGHLQVFFENKRQGILINMLSDEMIATAYAMTIHKSQGSEFEHVAICFDDSNARLLSQELIYTAVTRAKKQVSIFSTQSAFTLALATPTIRQTGLSLQFDAIDEASWHS